MRFGGLEIQTVYLMSLGISLVLMAGFALFFKYSKHGPCDAGDRL